MGWIYAQLNGNDCWNSEVGAIHRTAEQHYPFPDVHAFTDRWGLFKKWPLTSLLYRYPKIGIVWLLHNYNSTEFDVMHCHFGNFGFWALPIKEQLKIPMVTMFYGVDASRLPEEETVWRKRYLELFHKGDLFLVEGNHMKSTLMKLGCAQEKIMIFHLGVDVAKTPFERRKFEEGENLKLLAAGSFREKKGLPYAVEAFARAKKEYARMTLTIIGDSSGADREEEEKRKIVETIKRHSLEDSVTFLGFQPHDRFIEELYKHHLFISPSITASDGDTEGGSPVAITEASASGMPVVSTWHCDIPEVVLDGKTGLLSGEKDVEGLHKAIVHFIKDDVAVMEYGSQGRAHIENEYNISRQLLELDGIYRRLTNNPTEAE